MKQLRFIIALLTLCLLTTHTFARPEKKGRFKQMISELKLTQDQIKKLSEYRQKNKGAMKEIRTERKALKESMKEAFISKSSNSKLEAMHAKMGELHNKSADIRFKKMLFLKDLLSKEQREGFMARRNKRSKKR